MGEWGNSAAREQLIIIIFWVSILGLKPTLGMSFPYNSQVKIPPLNLTQAYRRF